MNWISVKDELPEHDKEVLATNGEQVIACRIDAESFDCIWLDGCGFGGYAWEFDFEWEDVTHWMPIPEPPK